MCINPRHKCGTTGVRHRTSKQNLNIFRDTYTGGEAIEDREGMIRRGSELPLGKKGV